MNKVKLCKMCRNRNINTLWENGYYDWLKSDCYECPRKTCKNNLIDTIIDSDEYGIIIKISEDVNFIEAMIDLKEKDIIEYQLKLNQFRATIFQMQVPQQESNQVTCPYCNSTDTHKITVASKAVNTVVWGVLGTKRHSNYHCNNCNSDF